MKTSIRIRYLSDISLEEEMFQKRVVEEINIHILYSITPAPLKIEPFMRYVEKYCRVGQATDDNAAHAPCMMGIEDYRYILRIRNIYCFSKATVVMRTREMLRLYVHCLSY